MEDNVNVLSTYKEMKFLATIIGGLGMLTAFGHYFPEWLNAVLAAILGGSTGRLQFMIDPKHYAQTLEKIPQDKPEEDTKKNV